MNATEQAYRTENGSEHAGLRHHFDTARETAARSVAYGEDCVRRHPEGALGATFFMGLCLGGLLGWALSEFSEDSWRRDLRRMVARMQDRLHL